MKACALVTNLERTAAGIAIPVDHFGAARAYCGVDAGAHRVWFALDGGRQRSPFVGPPFERPRDAIALANLLNGDPTPHSRDDSRDHLTGRLGVRPASRRPDVTPPVASGRQLPLSIPS
jgi:hypothetical protein